MIDLEKLVDGAWYDGFVWCNGKQRGVATARWHQSGLTFIMDMHPAQEYVTYGLYTGLVGTLPTFEPNVISIGEPAS